MENREQQKQIPIKFEAKAENSPDLADKTGGSEGTDSADQLQDDKIDAAQAEEIHDPEEISLEAIDESDEENQEENQSLSAAEIAQVLIDLSDAQERSAKLTEEKKILYDQLMRRQAEFENFRKRIERERTETQTRVRADIIAELLPVLDNLERAFGSGLQVETSEGVNEGIVAGVKLIHRQFLDVLTGLGLSPIKAIGETFDPHLHEAVTTEVNKQLPENT